MKSPLFFVFSVSALIVGCGDEVSVSFGSLSGSYQLKDNCFIHVSGSKGEATCTWQDDPDLPTEQWSGELSFKLGEKDVTATLTAVKQERWCDWWDDTCEPWTICTYSISGRAEKRVGRSAQGTFEALAGSWSGFVNIHESCRYEGSGIYTTESDVIFTPEIGGNAASFSYTETRNGVPLPQQFFSVTAEDGGLLIDGEWVRKL